ncbi:cytochrome P450 [Podospora didyma]|uniref:Cytochrome P450 n=1 Tax=Podospora didyma TaxID=330526 RepID=A0AAE0K6E5_9PEZI|nr:cytochrome P450 [Podospora didyma]
MALNSTHYVELCHGSLPNISTLAVAKDEASFLSTPQYKLGITKHFAMGFMLLLALSVVFTTKNHFRPIPTLATILKSVERRAKACAFLLYGLALIQYGFMTSKDGPFEVLTPSNHIVFISSPSQITELEAASGKQLLLYAASLEILQPKYTMHGLDMSNYSSNFARAVRVFLANQLPQLLPPLLVSIRNRIAEMHARDPIADDNVTHPCTSWSGNLFISAGTAIFGEDLANNEAFMKAAFEYIEQVASSAEIIRLAPAFLAPIVGRTVAYFNKRPEILFNSLFPIAEERLRERELVAAGQTVPKHHDLLQYLLDASAKDTPWTPIRLVQEVMAIWLIKGLQMATTAIYDLCLHPEHTAPLRREIAIAERDGDFCASGLPLLDSFIKESTRLSPADCLSTRRQAIAPFSLNDGTHLNVGDWLCTPVAAIAQHYKHFPEPTEFSGFRFVDQSIVEKL